MKVIYSDEQLEFDKVNIFLAGPTPRSKSVQSWRPEAIKILEKLKFDGIVFVPEHRDWNTKFNYIDQVEWEYKALTSCILVVFWIPRDLETLPGFTTNVEFGRYVNSGKILYGRPDNCPKNDYLDWLYKKITNNEPYNSLEKLLKEAVASCVRRNMLIREKGKDLLTQQQAQERFLPLIQAYGQVYHKKTMVLARLAKSGEVVHTITSDGKETSNTAKEGDYVVQNMTTAKEEYILSPDKLAKRYQKIKDIGEWTQYKATGSVRGIRFNGYEMGMPDQIQFIASWNEPMMLKTGDMVVTTDGEEVYRIARKEFEETYSYS